MTDPDPELIETGLRIFHGKGPFGWSLLKNQWPEAAVNEERRKMAMILKMFRGPDDK